MRLTAIDFLGFRFPDTRLTLSRGAPKKALLFEGPNGSGKTTLCDLLFACLQLAAGGSGPARYARPPHHRAKATVDVMLAEEDAARMGTGRGASFECFFGEEPMLDAPIDPDPAAMMVMDWRGRGSLAARLDEDPRSPIVGGDELLLDLAMADGAPEGRGRALSAALGDAGLPIDGLMRREHELEPAFRRRDERTPLSQLSTGERAMVNVLATAAAAPHRYLLLDCVDGALDREAAERSLRMAVALFGGWQLVIATRKRGLELGTDVERISLPLQGAPTHG